MEHHNDPVAAHAAERDAQDNMHMDDINIPLVAVSVAFFGVLLAVTIVGLQAWFYGQQTTMRQNNMFARDSVETDLGKLWHKQRLELHDVNAPWRGAATTAPATATATATATARKRMTIDAAIASIVKDGE